MPLRRFVERARALLRAALVERATPKQIAIAVGVGTFVGLTPAVGFHGGLALAIATLLRVNRLFCLLGSRISNPVTGPPLILVQIQIAHRLRTGQWLGLTVDTVLARAPELLLDWMVGLLVVGSLVSMFAAGLAYAWASRRKLRPTDAQTPV